MTTDAQLRQLLARLEDVPSDLRTKVRNSGGGYLNHKQFFSQLTPRGAALGSETRLMADIRAEFGAFEAFERRFLTEAKALFGSGFVWLVKDAKSGRLRLSKYVNQDNPAMDGVGNVALLGCDCWEHAWYYQYGPKKADYIDAWWRVVDWNSVSALYDAATV